MGEGRGHRIDDIGPGLHGIHNLHYRCQQLYPVTGLLGGLSLRQATLMLVGNGNDAVGAAFLDVP